LLYRGYESLKIAHEMNPVWNPEYPTNSGQGLKEVHAVLKSHQKGCSRMLLPGSLGKQMSNIFRGNLKLTRVPLELLEL
jgi:hypothetical protein